MSQIHTGACARPHTATGIYHKYNRTRAHRHTVHTSTLRHTWLHVVTCSYLHNHRCRRHNHMPRHGPGPSPAATDRQIVVRSRTHTHTHTHAHTRSESRTCFTRAAPGDTEAQGRAPQSLTRARRLQAHPWHGPPERRHPRAASSPSHTVTKAHAETDTRYKRHTQLQPATRHRPRPQRRARGARPASKPGPARPPGFAREAGRLDGYVKH